MTRFRCSPAGNESIYGSPKRAEACKCAGLALVEEDMCVRCGRFLSTVIDRTWQSQNRLLLESGEA